VAIAAFLDEARRDRHHPILSVGGIVLPTDDWLALEEAWGHAKVRTGLDPAKAVRYADTWDDHTLRLPLIKQIPNLGVRLKAVAALLEDFRPEEMRQRKETRRDMYIQRWAFAYVLQRLAERQYLPRNASGPHVVFAHRHDDFRCYDEEYAKAWTEGWTFPAGGACPRSGTWASRPARPRWPPAPRWRSPTSWGPSRAAGLRPWWR
jgi:hypothetical protein